MNSDRIDPVEIILRRPTFVQKHSEIPSEKPTIKKWKTQTQRQLIVET